MDALAAPTGRSSWPGAGATWASGCVRGTFKGVSGVVMYTVDFGRRVR